MSEVCLTCGLREGSVVIVWAARQRTKEAPGFLHTRLSANVNTQGIRQCDTAEGLYEFVHFAPPSLPELVIWGRERPPAINDTSFPPQFSIFPPNLNSFGEAGEATNYLLFTAIPLCQWTLAWPHEKCLPPQSSSFSVHHSTVRTSAVRFLGPNERPDSSASISRFSSPPPRLSILTGILPFLELSEKGFWWIRHCSVLSHCLHRSQT